MRFIRFFVQKSKLIKIDKYINEIFQKLKNKFVIIKKHNKLKKCVFNKKRYGFITNECHTHHHIHIDPDLNSHFRKKKSRHSIIVILFVLYILTLLVRNLRICN